MLQQLIIISVILGSKQCYVKREESGTGRTRQGLFVLPD